MSKTAFKSKCEILSEFWSARHDGWSDLPYGEDYEFDQESFAEIVEDYDIGLPLAYCIHEGIVKSTPDAEGFINEAWDILLLAMQTKDKNFKSLDELAQSAGTDF